MNRVIIWEKIYVKSVYHRKKDYSNITIHQYYLKISLDRLILK